jgi:hypothetical protein
MEHKSPVLRLFREGQGFSIGRVELEPLEAAKSPEGRAVNVGNHANLLEI